MLQRIGLDGHRFPFPPSLRDFLIRLEFDLFEFVLRSKRLLLCRHLGFDRIVEILGKLKIDDVELVDQDIPVLKSAFQLSFDFIANHFSLVISSSAVNFAVEALMASCIAGSIFDL